MVVDKSEGKYISAMTSSFQHLCDASLIVLFLLLLVAEGYCQESVRKLNCWGCLYERQSSMEHLVWGLCCEHSLLYSVDARMYSIGDMCKLLRAASMLLYARTKSLI